jgi:NAD(P)-dependent dehydrogenase (short-subunit alcohol dehydrogenase family)
MAKQPRILTGQVALVTGGARGIGKATAQAFAREGMKVAIGDLDAGLAEQAAAEIGGGAIGLALDVTSRESFESFVATAEERLGPVDVLVNNAGIMPLGRFADEDDATAARMIDINLHGVILGMKIALNRMQPRGRGHIVNIASQAGKYGAPGGATYSATKHAVVGLTEAVRGELRLDGLDIDLSYVMPYVVNTELGGGTAQARGYKNLEPEDVADAIVDALKHRVVEVWVPKQSRHTHRLTAILPRRASEGIAHLIKADQVLAHADPNARRDYELRAARSAPAIEPGADDDPKQLSALN